MNSEAEAGQFHRHVVASAMRDRHVREVYNAGAVAQRVVDLTLHQTGVGPDYHRGVVFVLGHALFLQLSYPLVSMQTERGDYDNGED